MTGIINKIPSILILLFILVLTDIAAGATMKTSEIEGYLLEESRVEGDGREGFAWSGRFRSDGKIINVLVHYNTDLSEPTDYSYQLAKRDNLVLTVPLEKKGNALYWKGFKEDARLFVQLGKHAYEFSLQENRQAYPVQAKMPPAAFEKMEMPKEERLKELSGPQKQELTIFAKALLSQGSLLATKKFLEVERLRFRSGSSQGKDVTATPPFLSSQSLRIDLPFREGEKIVTGIVLKEKAIQFFPKTTRPVKPVPCKGCETAIKFPQYNLSEKWVTKKTDPKGNVRLEFEVDNVTKKTLLIRNSDGDYQFTANLYIRYGRPVEAYLDGKKKREFADTPEDLDLQKLKNLIMDDLDLAYDPDENRFGKGELSREALAIIKKTFPDWDKLLYLPFGKQQPMVFTKEDIKGLLQRLKEPFITEKTWRSSETDPFYWDLRMAEEVGLALYSKLDAPDDEKKMLREVADIFLTKVKNLRWPSSVTISKDTKRYEYKDESFAPHFYAVIAIAKAYEIFNEEVFWEQAIKQIEFAEKELLKQPQVATLDDLIRLGHAYKLLSKLQASLVQGRSFLNDYKEVAALSLMRFKDWREEQLRNNDLHASFFDMELKLFHLQLPEFYFETDI